MWSPCFFYPLILSNLYHIYLLHPCPPLSQEKVSFRDSWKRTTANWNQLCHVCKPSKPVLETIYQFILVVDLLANCCIFLANEDRIIGLMFLLTIALRCFTLIEFQVRQSLQTLQTHQVGLYTGNPKRKTERPSAEQLLKAFVGMTLYHHRDGTIRPLQG